MVRRKHPSKDVEAVLQELEQHNWTIVERGGGHAWGLLRCPFNSPDCRSAMYCQMSINSTPQNSGSHAAKLKQKALSCTKAMFGKV